MSTRAQTLRKSTRQSSQSQNEVAEGSSTSLHANTSTDKENRANGNGPAAAATVATVKHDPDGPRKRDAKVAHGRAKKAYCSCRQPDDGTPMILCSECKEWYHFRCLDLNERDAEDIQLYVCPSCQEKTGLRSVMEWEGPDALEERKVAAASTRKSVTPAPATTRTSRRRQTVVVELRPRQKKVPAVKKEDGIPEETETSDDGSEDEYIAEEEGEQSKAKAKGKKRAVAPDSDTDTDGGESRTKNTANKNARRPSTASLSARTRTHSKSASPEPHTRRRKSSAAFPTDAIPAAKRKRTNTQSSQTAPLTSGSGSEDAARKYCLTKLQDIFINIFLRYPALQSTTDGEDESQIPLEKTTEELTEEEKETLRDRARKFSAELEECMYELYAEPDKTGKHSVAAKYKERFRMLSFNLSQSDRVALHKRIAASHIAPRELSTMSSTDLANEETKQNIRQAEQEALAHSILKKTLLPRAKITHKGLEDIEDVNDVARREEREREQEEEERIERERQERLKLQTERAKTGQPPDSPVTPHTPSWGGPPSVPMHALHMGSGEGGMRPPLNPLFIPTPSELATPAPPVEGELNLADLINIDEEPGQEVSISLASDVPLPSPGSTPLPSASPSAAAESPAQASEEVTGGTSPPPPTPSTGISPFASRTSYPEGTPRPSFDLNAIWSAPATKDEALADDTTTEEHLHAEHDDDEAMSIDTPEENHTDTPLSAEAHDHDFDMFLDGGEEDHAQTAQSEDVRETPQVAFEDSPKVWSGKLSMPLDSTIPQEVSVTAQQLGGRSLDSESTSWRILFPADHLRIDGRVPMDKSAQYLTQMRLNPNKELIAVAFSPDSPSSAILFDTLAKHLIAKGRHGLIFPWGNRPKEHHPGRELYIVPLLPMEPIPDFIELLDDLRLPATRTQVYLIGIWVLTRGKLEVASPPTPVPSTAAPPLAAQLTLPFSQLPLPPSVPLPSAVPVPVQLPPSTQAPNFNSSALAAEVATLTPEQIQMMLRTLTSNGAVPPPGLTQPPPPMPPLPPQPVPPYMSALPPGPPPPWPGPAGPAYAPPYGPDGMHPPPPPPNPYGSPGRYEPEPEMPPYPPTGYGRGRDRDRGEERGRGRRGRGPYGRKGNQNQQERQRDNGWRGRARGRGGGGGGQGRGQWRDGGQQQWS